MKTREYRIATTEGIKTVKGYPVAIEGFEGVEFFAHHPFLVGVEDADNKTWNISEVITGMAVNQYNPTIKIAKIDAKDILDKGGIELLKKVQSDYAMEVVYESQHEG